MKIVKRDKEFVKVCAECLEDLWALTKVVSAGDAVSGSSVRRFKTEGLTRGSSGEKKRVTIKLRIESVEFAENASKLRFTGVIISGYPEKFVQAGEYHTLDLAVRECITIEKEFNSFEREVLAEAVKARKRVKASVAMMDEHGALVALVGDRVKFVCSLSNYASKRDPKGFEGARAEFYGDLAKVLVGQEADNYLVAGPGFAPQAFADWLKNKHHALAGRVLVAHASTAEKPGVFELLKTGAIERVLEDKKLSEDFTVVEEFKKRVAKNGAACYGLDEVKQAVQARAVESIILLDSLLRRGNSHAVEANALLDAAKSGGAIVRLLDSSSEAGLEFESFGVGAILRYKLK